MDYVDNFMVPEILVHYFDSWLKISLLFWVGGGGWVGEINNIDHLSPVETEIRTELGKNNHPVLMEN